MFSEKTILTRLYNGESIENITKEITSIINSANKTYKKETAKTQELENIIKLMGQWLNSYYDVPFEDIKTGEVIALVETVLDSVNSLDAHFKTKLKGSDKKSLEVNKVPLEDVSTAIIDSFLKTMGW